MITELELENYRCFDKHRIPLKLRTVIVGRNNVGKSTVVEALRLIAIVAARCLNLPAVEPPDWLFTTGYDRVVRPSLRRAGLNLDAIFYRYGDAPAHAKCTVDTGVAVSVHIDEERILYGVVGPADASSAPSGHAPVPEIRILPQVGPVAAVEDRLTPDYVRSAMSSPLAALHFRNQLYYADCDAFEEFRELAESSWQGLSLKRPYATLPTPKENEKLYFDVRDGDFVADIAAMGHGLQMWLQVMWFLTNCRGADSVILDEPDVYMHADLQRRLVRLVQSRHEQTIIATHSVEVLSQVEPEHVLVLDRTRRASKFAISLPGVQQIIDHMGGVHNVQVARLWSTQRFLLLEGGDLGVLRSLHATLFPGSATPLDSIPHISIGGWGGWDHFTSSGLLLRNAAGRKITTYCFLDRDYHSKEQIRERKQEARQRRVQLHIWDRKELENYLIVPAAIARVIAAEVGEDGESPSTNAIEAEIQQIADQLRDKVLDGLATEYYFSNRSGGPSKAYKAARDLVKTAYQTLGGVLALLPGKEVLRILAHWSHERYGVGLSARRIARELTVDEIAQEIRKALTAIDRGRPF